MVAVRPVALEGGFAGTVLIRSVTSEDKCEAAAGGDGGSIRISASVRQTLSMKGSDEAW